MVLTTITNSLLGTSMPAIARTIKLIVRYRNSRQEGRRKRDKMMAEKRAVYVLKRGGYGWNELYREFVYFVLLETYETNISNDIGFP